LFQTFIALFILAYLDDGMFSVPLIQLMDQRWDKMRVFEAFLYGWRMWTRSLAFSRIWLSIGMLAIIVSTTRAVYLIPCLIFQKTPKEIVKRIATESSRLVVS
jgi:hypothetical protein